MYYVYLLRLVNRKIYTGSTPDLKRRIKEHNSGKSKATKYKIPYKLIFYEAFTNIKDAKHREEYLKSEWGFRSLNKMLGSALGEVA